VKHNNSGDKHQADPGESAPASIVVDNDHSTSGTNTSQDNQTSTKPREPRALIIWTAVLAIGTVVLGCAAIWSDFLVKDTGERELRAYLDIESTAPLGLIPNESAIVHLATRNSGRTPAYHITPYAFAEIRSFPEPRFEIYRVPGPGLPLKETVINPNRTYEIEVTTDFALTNEQVNEIVDGSRWRMYVYGTVYFIDAFGYQRYANFCEIMGGREMKSGVYCAHRGAD
jgi:hypothetical protein